MFALGLPVDYYQRMAERVAAVSAKDVAAALHQVLDPAAMRIVAVGDRSKIVDQLAEVTGTTPLIVSATGDRETSG
jgi:zinc protease